MTELLPEMTPNGMLLDVCKIDKNKFKEKMHFTIKYIKSWVK